MLVTRYHGVWIIAPASNETPVIADVRFTAGAEMDRGDSGTAGNGQSAPRPQTEQSPGLFGSGQAERITRPKCERLLLRGMRWCGCTAAPVYAGAPRKHLRPVLDERRRDAVISVRRGMIPGG
ncbi:MAG TPA: hypothetical protein VEF72_17785 [Mycobacterium sp.]|nr:hypothetical protein [Mycobacterium sp.]